ncbi:MAG TPA: solute carrier family 23 protein, partial [Thermodesulfobacteriota bacterium]|nr:solute carrier family 23 protein [Thermodesulfobacteriota bacterium]
GHLTIGLAPHTSGGILCRIIGYTDAQVCYGHPFFHAAKRRNADGDEDSVMLLLDGLLNFSRAYLPDSRGGLILILIGAMKWFGRVSRFFTPNVVGVILILVSLTLLPFLYPPLIGMSDRSPGGEIGVFGWSVLIMLFVSFLSDRLPGFLQTASMLAGILFGFAVFAFRGEISFDIVNQADWFAVPFLFTADPPSFSWAAVISISFTYIAVLVNTVGSIEGIAEIVGREGLDKRLDRGIAMTGAGGVVAGMLGAVGVVSFSISPGVVVVTRVASRYVLAMAGAIMIVCAFIPKIWAVLTAIPAPVIAAVLFVALASQFMAGVNVIVSGRGRAERRDYFTVGIPVLFGTAVSLLPKTFFQAFPDSFAALASNGLVMGIFFSLVLEHLIFRPSPLSAGGRSG